MTDRLQLPTRGPQRVAHERRLPAHRTATASLPAETRCDGTKEVPTDGALECDVAFAAPRTLSSGEPRFDPERHDERTVAWQVP